MTDMPPLTIILINQFNNCSVRKHINNLRITACFSTEIHSAYYFILLNGSLGLSLLFCLCHYFCFCFRLCLQLCLRSCSGCLRSTNFIHMG